MTTVGKTWRRRKRERPDEIRSAALLELSNGNFDNVTMKQIAQRAGVSKATIYLYYSSKTALLEALREEGADDFRVPISVNRKVAASHARRHEHTNNGGAL